MSMQRISNYGSFLQAYALKKVLEGLGHSVQFVDYRVGQVLIVKKQSRLKSFGKISEVLSYDASLRQRLQFLLYKKQFSQKYHHLLSIKREPNYTPELDVLVIGSDEVFNCCQSNSNVGYSLELFGKDSRSKRLITYAASFGNTTLSKLESFGIIDEICNLLRKFDAISVRDKNSFQIVAELTGLAPKQHIDPTLVYDFTRDENIKDLTDNIEKYLILYSYSGRITKAENKKIRKYASSRGLKILSIGGIHGCADRFVDCSPFEVFAYFRHAVAIITDTFHGTIFSIINQRPFATLVRRSIENSYGNEEKLDDLLEKVDLANRKLKTIDEMASVLNKKVDWEAVSSKLDILRKEAFDYLSKECVLNNE
jgi:hypothetical protein